MMGIPPSEARSLSYWEYTALHTVWNDRHSGETGEAHEPSEKLRTFLAAHRDG